MPYRLARVEASAGDTDAALRHLEDVLDVGFADPAILDEADFEPLRGDPRFEEILGEVRRRLDREG
jgi:hypothetical protein